MEVVVEATVQLDVETAVETESRPPITKYDSLFIYLYNNSNKIMFLGGRMVNNGAVTLNYSFIIRTRLTELTDIQLRWT